MAQDKDKATRALQTVDQARIGRARRQQWKKYLHLNTLEE